MTNASCCVLCLPDCVDWACVWATFWSNWWRTALPFCWRPPCSMWTNDGVPTVWLWAWRRLPWPEWNQADGCSLDPKRRAAMMMNRRSWSASTAPVAPRPDWPAGDGFRSEFWRRRPRWATVPESWLLSLRQLIQFGSPPRPSSRPARNPVEAVKRPNRFHPSPDGGGGDARWLPAADQLANSIHIFFKIKIFQFFKMNWMTVYHRCRMFGPRRRDWLRAKWQRTEWTSVW